MENKKNKQLISVVIPSYCRGFTTLPRAVSSVKGDCEIFIIDDYSLNGTWGICNILKESDSRIKTYRMSPNAGLFRVRIYSLSLISGEYILFLDDDDELYPEAIEILSKLIEKYNHPDLIHFVNSIDDTFTGKPWNIFLKHKDIWPDDEHLERYFNGKDDLKKYVFPLLLTTYHFNSLCNCCFKASLLREAYKIRDKLDHPTWEEDLYIKLLSFPLLNNAVFLCKPLYKYDQKTVDSMTRSEEAKRKVTFEMLKSYIIVESMKFKYVEICGLDKNLYKRFYYDIFRLGMKAYLKLAFANKLKEQELLKNKKEIKNG